MLKRVLIAAAAVIASPALVSAQDLFLSFDTANAQNVGAGPAGSVGSVNLFSAVGFAFDAIDLIVTSSDTSVLSLSGGVGSNPTFPTVDGLLFDSTEVSVNADGSARFFAVNVTENGVNPGLNAAGFNPAFVPGVGTLLATIDYSVLSGGDAQLSLSVGEQGILALPDTELGPTVQLASGSASFTAEPAEIIPEPSSIALLLLGSVGLVSRRKRS